MESNENNKFNLESPDVLSRLIELRDSDIDEFSNLILECLKVEPTFAITDTTPIEKKIKALNLLLNHFESKEMYEDCSFISDIIQKILNG